jgi:hypothetical protein
MDSSMDKIKARIATKKRLVEEKAAAEAAKKKEDRLEARKEMTPSAMDGLTALVVSGFDKEGTMISGSTHKYIIDVTPTGEGDNWQTRKRYSEFETLHSVLVHRLKDVSLPPKSLSYDPYERQKGLHFYLNATVGQWALLSPEMQHTLRHFLGFAEENTNDVVFRLSTLPVNLYHSKSSVKLREEVAVWEANLGPENKAQIESWCAKPEGFLFLRHAPRGWERFESDETGRNTLGSQNLSSMSGFAGVTTGFFKELYFVFSDSLNLCYFDKPHAQQFLGAAAGSSAPPPPPDAAAASPQKQTQSKSRLSFSTLSSVTSKMKSVGKAAVSKVSTSVSDAQLSGKHLLNERRLGSLNASK